MTTRWEVERAVLGSTLDPQARLLVLVLAVKVDNDTAVIPPEFSPSFSTLEAATGLSRSMLSKWLDTLESLGWVKRSKPPKGSRYDRTHYALAVGDNPERVRRPSRRWKPASSSSQEPLSGSPEEPQPTSMDGSVVLPKNYSSSSPQELPVVLPKNGSPGPSSSSQEPASSKTSTTKSSSSSARKPRASTKDTNDAAADSPTTQTLLGEWIRHCAAHNVQLPKRLTGHYARVIHDALGENFKPEMVRDALMAMLRAGKSSHPSLLPNFIVEVQAKAGGTGGGQANANTYHNPENQDAYDDWLKGRQPA